MSYTLRLAPFQAVANFGGNLMVLGTPKCGGPQFTQDEPLPKDSGAFAGSLPYDTNHEFLSMTPSKWGLLHLRLHLKQCLLMVLSLICFP